MKKILVKPYPYSYGTFGFFVLKRDGIFNNNYICTWETSCRELVLSHYKRFNKKFLINFHKNQNFKKIINNIRKIEDKLKIPSSKRVEIKKATFTSVSRALNPYLIELNWWGKNKIRFDILTALLKDETFDTETITSDRYFKEKSSDFMKHFLKGNTCTSKKEYKGLMISSSKTEDFNLLSRKPKLFWS